MSTCFLWFVQQQPAFLGGVAQILALLRSSPNVAEATARNPLLLELESKVEALGLGISDLLREQTGIVLRSRSPGVLVSLGVGGEQALQLAASSESSDPRRLAATFFLNINWDDAK